MTSYTSGNPTQNRTAPQSIGFLLLDNFTLISLASAVEPLRMANQLSGRELYRWHTLTVDGGQVWASDGLQITPDAAMHSAPLIDTVIVCGGVGIQRTVTREHVTWLQAQARQSRRLGAVCTGSWALACAGLLDGFDCSVHWECLAAMQEAFPRVNMSTRLFTLDRNRFTSSGGTAPLDMMLHLISRDHGRELSAAISEMFVYERIRNEQDHQRVPLKHMLGTNQPKLQEIVALMEANLEEPIDLDELAVYVSVSRRQLERLFQKYLHCSPSRYYLKLRLIRARQLLKQTPMSIIEVASVCGFVSTPHFSKCYREYFGIPPRDERVGSNTAQQVAMMPIPQAMTLSPHSGPMAALSQARNESTFASVRL
ncbi:TPA: GlxA family transcriptional regulator [Pseudomonas putida]|uniref:choline metabolism transcriptional regulator GbdR n=1 Tax=unclassified Pseudomonas TaxID=196821 RepID=UPI000480BEF1|nr:MULTISPECIES: GlxA family transcriptional regulator [unclassified Pseudomonas]RAS27700.1 AraC family transcriptional regulator with amidase-like domain [Pseudomonas sp. URMO17WK12:I7]SMF46483.1 transcriptional regulator, AraC family with amidase-like domain [Pseudomonas sp. URMO17WK12:I5]HDS1683915.1 GlxA family transcriptional regulator [Pseudomonas putida]